jgi:hypothetical protein|uniref:Uncharacterized protein n=1 Tax=Desulfobacca acetoxidans TaxID=60893 RepID=A0A7C3UYU7_9BACT
MVKKSSEDGEDLVARLRISDGRYEACCEYCGAWREVQVRQLPGDLFFENYQADFSCCGVSQTARLAVEKDELDFH